MWYANNSKLYSDLNDWMVSDRNLPFSPFFLPSRSLLVLVKYSLAAGISFQLGIFPISFETLFSLAFPYSCLIVPAGDHGKILHFLLTCITVPNGKHWND